MRLDRIEAGREELLIEPRHRESQAGKSLHDGLLDAPTGATFLQQQACLLVLQHAIRQVSADSPAQSLGRLISREARHKGSVKIQDTTALIPPVGLRGHLMPLSRSEDSRVPQVENTVEYYLYGAEKYITSCGQLDLTTIEIGPTCC